MEDGSICAICGSCSRSAESLRRHRQQLRGDWRMKPEHVARIVVGFELDGHDLPVVILVDLNALRMSDAVEQVLTVPCLKIHLDSARINADSTKRRFFHFELSAEVRIQNLERRTRSLIHTAERVKNRPPLRRRNRSGLHCTPPTSSSS